MTEQGERHGGFARAGLADQAEDLTGGHRKGDVADHVGPGVADVYREVRHFKPGGAGRSERACELIGAEGLAGSHLATAAPRSETSAASSGLRSTPMATRATASVNVFVPMVSSAISAAGTITAHGFTARPIRFSLIIVPQFAAGGGWPKPRKANPAMMTIEYVSRSPASTMSGATRLGMISVSMILAGGIPCSSTALT